MTRAQDPLAPRTLCVADANVLFDLRNGRILAALVALPYRFVVPDAVFAELDPAMGSMLLDLGFEIGHLEAQTILEVYTIRPEHPRLSVPDLFAFFVARDRGAMLLTGDSRLRRLAESHGLVVHGTLWILDELFARQKLDGPSAWAVVEDILALGGRLPAEECQRRRMKWR